MAQTRLDRLRRTLTEEERRIGEAIDECLKQARHSTGGYDAYEPLAQIRLVIVDEQARQLLAHELLSSPLQRDLSPEDRRRGACAVIKHAAQGLRPSVPLITPEQDAALAALPVQKWPTGLPLPAEALLFLFLGYTFLWDRKPNKAMEYLLGVSEREIPYLRAEAAYRLAVQVAAAEHKALAVISSQDLDGTG